MERVEKQPGDLLLLITIVLLAGIGLSVLFSASFHHGERLAQDPYYFFRRQALWVLLGTGLGAVAARTPLQVFHRGAPILLLAALVLMLLPFLPGLGRPVAGARRWIFLFGQSFQPSELAKLAVVLYLAMLFGKKGERMDDPLNAILPPLIVVAVFVGLTYLQNDYSTAMFILFIALAMFYVAGVRLRYFLLLGPVVLPAAGLLLFTREHRVRRLITFLNPLADPAGSGYQVIAARAALVGGGIWGRGLGRGVKKLGGLPEAHSDFIFAVAAEETGFIGALAIVLLFLIFAWRGYRIALSSRDDFRTYLAFGLTSLVIGQALLNVAVVIGLMPATGIPLPFFSAGGTSILVTLIMCGLLINLSRREAEGVGAPEYLRDDGWSVPGWPPAGGGPAAGRRSPGRHSGKSRSGGWRFV